MIPQQMISQRATAQLMEYLRFEIPRALSERGELEEKWIRWHKQYRCQPEQEFKEFPFLGASNLVAPLIATDVDTLFARIMGHLYAPDNLLSCGARRPDMMQFAARLQEFLQSVQESELALYPVVRDWVLEILKLGTGVLKTRYKRETKTIYEQWGDGDLRKVLSVLDRPEVSHVSLWDFLLPPMAKDIQGAPWASERILLEWNQYVSRVEAGLYLPASNLQQWMANSKGSNVFQQLMQADSYSPGLGTKLEVWETWLDYDIAASGERLSILATIHIPSASFLRIDFNPWLNQEKPFDAARFMVQEGRFYGIGLAEMEEPIQDEATALHNQRIDSGTIANSFMWKGKRGAIKDDEPIFPGRWFILDNMDDVQPLNMAAGKYDPSLNYEQATLAYAQKRSGVNDYILGESKPSIGYSTAYTTMEQKQTAVMRYDQTLREIRLALGSVGMKVVELYQQFNPSGKVYDIMGPEDGAIVQQYLQFPPELLRRGVTISVTASSESLNKEVAIRQDVMLMQMLSQYYMGAIQMLGVALNPMTPPPIKQLALMQVRGGAILMQRILDNSGIQDIKDFLPEELAAQQQQMVDMQQQLAGQMGGGMYGPTGPVAGGGVNLANYGGYAGMAPSYGQGYPPQGPAALLGPGAGGFGNGMPPFAG